MTKPRRPGDAPRAEAADRPVSTPAGGFAEERDVRPMENEAVIRPRRLPRSVGDAMVALATLPVALLMLLIFPVLVWKSIGDGTQATAVAGVIVFVAEVIAAALMTVRWIRLDARGIHFGRRRGRPKLIRWKDVNHVRRADRGDVVVGLLSMPPLGATRSLTARGYFVVYARREYVVYPPADEEAFLAALRRWCKPALLAPELRSRARV
ncbi:MAG TPA: hypothetical protein VF092_24660 [Longimicrobium sp.]